MWLTNLKIALVEKNTQRLDELLDSIPQLEKKEEIEEAIYLLKAASELVHDLKDKTETSMIQMKKNIIFLQATEDAKPNTLDIKL